MELTVVPCIFHPPATPIPVRVGVFAFAYTTIYIGRKAFGADRAININVFIRNNNEGGNSFNSPLEYGETLDNINTFVESIMIMNITTLVGFNLLILKVFSILEL